MTTQAHWNNLKKTYLHFPTSFTYKFPAEMNPRRSIKQQKLLFLFYTKLWLADYYMFGFFDVVNLLGSSLDTALHLPCGELRYESCEKQVTTLHKRVVKPMSVLVKPISVFG